jgi:glucokinase
VIQPGDSDGCEERYAIGFDVGGTKIAAGVVTGAGRIIYRRIIPTPQPADAATLQRTLIGLTNELQSSYSGVTAIGVGAAGLIDWPSGHIRWAPNSAYRDLPLQQILAAETGLPVAVENDANAAAWAEARVGTGTSCRDVIVITVGTGIGGGIVVDRTLLRGRTGIGAEVGHLIVNPTGRVQCGCGIVGCLEAMASGTALGRIGQAAASADPTGVIARMAGDVRNVTGETVFDAARQGNAVARNLFEQIGYWLGIGIASLVTLFDPELVVITGGLVIAGDLLLGPARNSFEQFVFARHDRALPAIVPARLGIDAGLIGAALLALDKEAIEPHNDLSCGPYPTSLRGT